MKTIFIFSGEAKMIEGYIRVETGERIIAFHHSCIVSNTELNIDKQEFRVTLRKA